MKLEVFLYMWFRKENLKARFAIKTRLLLRRKSFKWDKSNTVTRSTEATAQRKKEEEVSITDNAPLPSCWRLTQNNHSDVTDACWREQEENSAKRDLYWWFGRGGRPNLQVSILVTICKKFSDRAQKYFWGQQLV